MRLSKPSMHSLELGRAKASTPMIDTCAIVPILACAFALIVSPLLIFFTSGSPVAMKGLYETRHENKIFWTAIAALAVVLAVRHSSRLTRLTLPPHIICLLAYLAFAGASVLWAFKPELSLTRFVQQVMIVTSIILPAMLASPTADMVRSLFLCFAFASILNLVFVFGGSPMIVDKVAVGYPGYFPGKNYLGECAAIAFLLSLHEMLYRGVRRASGIIIAGVAIALIFFSNSKTSLGLALVAPVLAGFTLLASRKMRISPAIILLSIPLCYALLSIVSNSSVFGRFSYILYGDSSLTGRMVIWDFARFEIARKPLLGWGYQSFWLVGPDGPSVTDARGWVRYMPNSHNGYYDTMLEMGYVGLTLLVIFIIATLHAIGRMADRSSVRTWLVLSLALFIIVYNFLESTWMRGFEFLWLVFLIVAAESARYWRPFRTGGSSRAVATRRTAARLGQAN